MPIDPQGPGNYAPRERREYFPLVCAGCGADESLTLHSITALSPPSEAVVEVGYACTGCNLHYLHRADVAAVAAILNRAPCPDDVLVFGAHYIHCGQPMQKLGSQVTRIHAAAGVNLETRVLRCTCGFRIEVPS